MIVVGVLLTVVMVTLLAACQLTNYGVFNLRYDALNTDTHVSVFGVVSLVTEGCAAAVFWWRGIRERRRSAWFVLGALAVGVLPIRASGSLNPVLVGLPLTCMVGLLCWLTWRDPIVSRAVIFGALILMGISLLLHRVGLDADVLNYSPYSWAYQLTAVAKHGCELAGWLLLATGIVAGIGDRPAPESPLPETLARELESVAR